MTATAGTIFARLNAQRPEPTIANARMAVLELLRPSRCPYCGDRSRIIGDHLDSGCFPPPPAPRGDKRGPFPQTYIADIDVDRYDDLLDLVAAFYWNKVRGRDQWIEALNARPSWNGLVLEPVADPLAAYRARVRDSAIYGAIRTGWNRHR